MYAKRVVPVPRLLRDAGGPTSQHSHLIQDQMTGGGRLSCSRSPGARRAGVADPQSQRNKLLAYQKSLLNLICKPWSLRSNTLVTPGLGTKNPHRVAPGTCPSSERGHPEYLERHLVTESNAPKQPSPGLTSPA